VRDEGRSLGIGLQDQISNHPELHGLRVLVVSVSGKGRSRTGQIRTEKANASEPPTRRRKRMNVIETRLQSLAWDAVKARPAYGLDDDRRKGGASSVQALAGNVGTCRHDAKGEAQVEDP